MIRGNKLDFPQVSIILYYSISPYLYLVRVVAGDSGWAGILLRSLEPFLFLVVFLSFLRLKLIKVNGFICTYVLLGLYGVTLGAINDNSLIHIVSGATHYYTGVLLFLYFYTVDVSLNLDRFMRILGVCSITSISLVLLLMHLAPYLGLGHIYLGLACQILVIVFFYNVQQKKIIMACFSLMLIFASGKRGVLVALLLGVFISFIPFFIKYHSKGMMKILAAGLISVPFLVSINPVMVDKVVSKYSVSKGATLDAYSSGRVNEVSSAFGTWMDSNKSILAGFGFGFTYEYLSGDKNIPNVKNHRNVHFSYLNPLLVFGLPFAVIYFLALLGISFKIFSFRSRNYDFMKWSVFTYFVYASFVFNLFNEPILWMCIGVLLRGKRNLSQDFPVSK